MGKLGGASAAKILREGAIRGGGSLTRMNKEYWYSIVVAVQD
jgi:hypothetical protein